MHAPSFRRLAAAALLFAAAGAAQTNVLVNGDAETGTLAGWTDPNNAGFNVSAVTVHGGNFAFWPGVSGPASGSHSNELRQDVSIVALATAVDAGRITARFSGWGQSASAGGASDIGSISLEFLDVGGGLLAAFGTGSITPFNTWIQYADTRTVPAGTRTLRLRLMGTRSVGGSTDCYFDDLQLSLHEWELVGSGCAGAAGVPTITLSAPPLLGQNYACGVTNLAGGLAFVVTGLAPQNVPLQPFGFGFGPGCSSLVTPDVALFLPQNNGAAAWSLALPSAPAFAGLSLWHQVLELGGPSGVSRAAHAVLH